MTELCLEKTCNWDFRPGPTQTVVLYPEDVTFKKDKLKTLRKKENKREKNKCTDKRN